MSNELMVVQTEALPAVAKAGEVLMWLLPP